MKQKKSNVTENWIAVFDRSLSGQWSFESLLAIMNRWFHLPLVWLLNSRQSRAITVHALSIYFAFVLARQFKAKCKQNYLVLASQLSLQLRGQAMRSLRLVRYRINISNQPAPHLHRAQCTGVRENSWSYPWLSVTLQPWFWVIHPACERGVIKEWAWFCRFLQAWGSLCWWVCPEYWRKEPHQVVGLESLQLQRLNTSFYTRSSGYKPWFGHLESMNIGKSTTRVVR